MEMMELRSIEINVTSPLQPITQLLEKLPCPIREEGYRESTQYEKTKILKPRRF